MQDDFIAGFMHAADADPRVLAAWLEGSFGKGTADKFSDVDAHLLLCADDFDAFRQSAEDWIRAFCPLVLFRILFDGQMVNALSADGLRIDVWLHSGPTVARDLRHVKMLADKTGGLGLFDAVPSEADIPVKVSRAFDEFWRALAMLPAVAARGEWIALTIGVFGLTAPLTEVLVPGEGGHWEAGIAKVNRSLSDGARREIENALTTNGASLESAARVHVKLAAVMQRRGPNAAAFVGISYPRDLENAAVAYLCRELPGLGLGACLEELARLPE